MINASSNQAAAPKRADDAARASARSAVRHTQAAMKTF
jgi:hypothetical protein